MVMNKVKENIRVILGKIKMPKIVIPKIKIPSIKIPRIKMPNIKIPKINIEKLKAHVAKSFPIIKKVFEVLLKIVKGFISWLWKAVKESIAQVWTLLGFFIAWLTLTGTAQQVVGMATLIATAIWLITIPLREDKEE
jgi:hypothetical protein